MIKSKIAICMLVFLLLMSLSYQIRLSDYNRALSGIFSDSVQTCLTTENDSGKKWGKSTTDYSFGFSGSINDPDLNGSSGDDFAGSNDSERFTRNSMKLICPLSYSNGNTQSYNLTVQSKLTSFKTNTIDTSVIGWYYFSYDTNMINNLTFALTNSSYATTEIYIEKSNSTYTYLGDLNSTLTVSYSETTDKNIWLLVNPANSNSYADFSVFTNPKPSSSSSNSSTISNIFSSPNKVITIAIIVGGTIGVAIVIGGISFCIACKIKRKHKNRKEKYAQKDQPNPARRNNRTGEENHVSQLSVAVDEYRLRQNRLTYPNLFQSRFIDSNFLRRTVPTRRISNNFLDLNGNELGFSAGSNFDHKDGVIILEGRKTNYEMGTTMDGAEMPVHLAK